MDHTTNHYGLTLSPEIIREESPARLMDRLYRVQRHFYDLTRKYYLLGRDTLLHRLALRGPQRVLEVGCGTARNLIRLARLYPEAGLYGLDASQEMLKSAGLQVTRQNLRGRIMLRHTLAEELHYSNTFGCRQPFDTIFFSYTLSMIPAWPKAVEAALANLKPGGNLWVVDFWDQAALPPWFARTLQWWLAQFHVHHRPQLLDYFVLLHHQEKIRLTLLPLYRRYAFLAKLEKPATSPPPPL